MRASSPPRRGVHRSPIHTADLEFVARARPRGGRSICLSRLPPNLASPPLTVRSLGGQRNDPLTPRPLGGQRSAVTAHVSTDLPLLTPSSGRRRQGSLSCSSPSAAGPLRARTARQDRFSPAVVLSCSSPSVAGPLRALAARQRPFFHELCSTVSSPAVAAVKRTSVTRGVRALLRLGAITVNTCLALSNPLLPLYVAMGVAR